MKEFLLKAPSESTSRILIERGGLAKLPQMIAERHPDSRVVIVKDNNLLRLHGESVRGLFPNATVLEIPAGEESKSWERAGVLLEKMQEAGHQRSDVLIAFGGGMVSDIGGLVASLHGRGMNYIAVPTSLLGMVDAAIGGKTGVNLGGAKNSVGSFYPAELVMIDPDLLCTLPEKELRTGLAEVIKYAGILDASLVEDLMQKPLSHEILIEKSVAAKVRIAGADLKEGGPRKVLNYGHTFGHAVESLSNYRISHGEAISIGMRLSNTVAQKLGKQSPETGAKIEALLAHHGLPTHLPEGMRVENMAELVRKDKKAHGDFVDFIIVTEMGKAEVVKMRVEELIKLVQS